MTEIKTASKDRLTSTDRDNPPTKLRSPSPPSPPAHDSRAPSLAPPSPKSIAARLTSPAPDPPVRATPAPERTPAPTTTPAARDASEEPQSDAADGDEEVQQENVINFDTFTQILDLDEDDTHDFSLGMAEAYFSQANSTFEEMDTAFKSRELQKLSSLGHFLKGSSAALGVSAVQATCEHIQHYGALRDEASGTDLTEDAALVKIAPLLKRVKREYAAAERWLQNWYKEHAVPAEV